MNFVNDEHILIVLIALGIPLVIWISHYLRWRLVARVSHSSFLEGKLSAYLVRLSTIAILIYSALDPPYADLLGANHGFLTALQIIFVFLAIVMLHELFKVPSSKGQKAADREL